MEHFFRTALWILVLIGCLQAVPVPHKTDFRFEFLEGTCPENKTFESPKNMSNSCLTAAVEIIIDGLKYAFDHCQCQYCQDPVEALELVKAQPIVVQSKTTQCRREKGSLTFGAFVKESEDVIDRISSLAKQ